MTTEIVASYVMGNSVPASDLPGLIKTVYGALGAPEAMAAEEPASVKLTPAKMRKSITPDAITSFEDGRSYKSMKRHLSTHGLTPDAYRAKWGLPKDYPMVAASYSAARSAMAKAIGLGAKGRSTGPAPKPVAAKGQRGRPNKPA
jgi:predicted transcriptional regulator